jgi:hypothetical protein
VHGRRTLHSRSARFVSRISSRARFVGFFIARHLQLFVTLGQPVRGKMFEFAVQRKKVA